MSGQRWRILLTAVLVVVGLLAFWDTFKLWTMSDSEKQAMQQQDPGKLLELQQSAIRLGLDLQGGIHVVLKVKTDSLGTADASGAVERAMQVIRTRIDGLGVAEPNIQKQGGDRIIIDLPGYTDANRAEELVGQMAVLEFKLLESMDNATLLLQKIDSVVRVREKALTSDSTAQTTSVQTNAAESKTDTAAADRADVLAEMMGKDSTKDTTDFGFDEELSASEDQNPFSSRLDQWLTGSQTRTAWPCWGVNKRDRQNIEKWLDLPEVKRLIPVDVQFAWSTRVEMRNQREVWDLYLLKRKVQFVGKYLENISLRRGQMGGHEVDFRVSSDGTGRFAQLTGANVNKPLAVVLDGCVESAPFINSKIRGSGTITMGGTAKIEDAVNMKIVLEAGALPAPVEIIEKNIVGASLGADSISKGFYSSIVALLIILVFIGVYYRVSGVIADIGLLFNVFFLLAVLAGLGATLTMPGIAGIILTIGISVDSNILIFERIREELRTGKTVRASIDAGYERAFVTIFDSHVTTLITAGALFIFGSGPIRGFAVTLFWGVTLSLYTAYVITKAIFDVRKTYQTISI
ncbi:MAG: protein translocase subunit SecD [candidate division Zixibacteria bacterium]|nr:protein translocase subunit SecD [candidate division Zixibacteria bacterium]